MRTGQTISLDFATAMAIFLFALAAGVFLFQNALSGGGFSEEVSSAGRAALTAFQQEAAWTVHGTPIAVEAATAADSYPVTVPVAYPRDIVTTSPRLTGDGTPLRASHLLDRNRTVAVTDIDSGTNRLTLHYTRDVAVPAPNYTDGLQASGDSIWHETLNITFATGGIPNLTYRGLQLVHDGDLATTATPVAALDALRANVTYDGTDRTTVRMYDDTGTVRATRHGTGSVTWRFNITSNVTTLYTSDTGTTQSLSGTGMLYEGATDMVDLSAVTGLAIIGDAPTVRIGRDDPGDPYRTNVTFTAPADIVLHAHDGDHTAALPRLTLFRTPPTATTGVPAPRTGLSRHRLDTLATLSYRDLRDRLGLAGLQYNISVGPVFDAGRNLTDGSDVSVFSAPAAVLAATGNATRYDLAIRVWRP